MSIEPKLPALFNALPVFPLPGTVLFPGTVVPLHIFEARYKTLIHDSLLGDKTLALVMIQPGDDELSNPRLCSVACLGQIIHSEKLDDGRYNILLQGVQRVELLSEVETTNPYRCFNAKRIPEPNDDDLRAAEKELVELQSCVLGLQTCAEHTDTQLVEVLQSTADPLVLIDILSAILVPDVHLQQQLLEYTDLRLRTRALNQVLIETMGRLGAHPSSAVLN